MQVIYGPGLASNILFTAQKRLVRPAYSNTLAHPYAAALDPYMRNADGSHRVPASGDTQGATPAGGAAGAPLTRSADVFTYQGSIVPGTVMVKTAGEYVVPAADSTGHVSQPFGLLAQWIGGTFDNLGQNNQVGVWQGLDSVYELLAPAWDDTNVGSDITTNLAATGGSIVDTLLYAQADGRLGVAKPTSGVPVARVLDRPTSSRLLIQLLV